MDLLAPLFRVYAALRVLLAVATVGLNLTRLATVARPGWMVGLTVVVLVWAIVGAVVLLRPSHRRTSTFAVDLGMTVVLALSSVWVIGYAAPPTVVAFSAAATPVGVSLWRGWRWGLGASLCVGLVGAIATWGSAPSTWPRLLVFVGACSSVGLVTSQLRQTLSEREQMYAVAAAMGERQRLARVVHDGVLQVLAMVEREGRSLGPRGTWLAHQAHQQEVALRTLLQDTSIDGPHDIVDETHANLSVLLDRHASVNVTVSTPAGAVLVETQRAREIDAAVSEALTNVARHAGPSAQAWVLLEREGGDILVSIRDNGVGADPQAFDEAVSRGRMGTRQSILGRLRDLGGSATMHTAPGRGVEWEFRVPVEE